MNQGGVEALVDLVAQPADPRLDNVRLRIEVIVPDVLHDHRLGNHPPGVTREIFEQEELPGLKGDFFVRACDRPRTQIDGEVPNGDPGGLGCIVRPANQGLDARQELGEGEGLGEVIAFTNKYYARGVGFILGVDRETGKSVQLVGCNFDPRCAALPTP